MGSKLKTILFALSALLLLICIIILISLRSSLCLNNSTRIETSSQTLLEVIYLGEHINDLRDSFNSQGITLQIYQAEESGHYKDKVILVDVSVKSLNYSELKKLSEQNSLYFINVQSMESISSELLDSNSYDVFIASDQDSKNCVRISTDQTGKKETLVFGYFMTKDGQYNDLVEQMIDVNSRLGPS